MLGHKHVLPEHLVPVLCDISEPPLPQTISPETTGKPGKGSSFPDSCAFLPETEEPHYIFSFFIPHYLPLSGSRSLSSFCCMFSETPQTGSHKAANLWYLKQRARCQSACRIGGEKTVIQWRNIIQNQTKWINNRGCRHTFILVVHVHGGLVYQPKWLVCWQSCWFLWLRHLQYDITSDLI